MSIKASWCFKSHTKNNHLSITSTKNFLTKVSVTVQEITYFYIIFFTEWVQLRLRKKLCDIQTWKVATEAELK